MVVGADPHPPEVLELSVRADPPEFPLEPGVREDAADPPEFPGRADPLEPGVRADAVDPPELLLLEFTISRSADGVGVSISATRPPTSSNWTGELGI